MSKTKRNFQEDYVKAIKKIMREEVGLYPTRVQKPKKAYKRSKYKNFDDEN